MKFKFVKRKYLIGLLKEAAEGPKLTLGPYSEDDSGFCKYNKKINEYAISAPENMAEVLVFVVSSQLVDWPNIYTKFPHLMNWIYAHNGMYPKDAKIVDKKLVGGFPSTFNSIVLGEKARSINAIWKDRDNVFKTLAPIIRKYNQMKSGEEKEEAAFELYQHILKLRHHKIPKGGFAVQLLIGRYGCIDSVNLNVLPVPEDLLGKDEKGQPKIKEFGKTYSTDPMGPSPSAFGSTARPDPRSAYGILGKSAEDLARMYKDYLLEIGDLAKDNESKILWDKWCDIVAHKINFAGTEFDVEDTEGIYSGRISSDYARNYDPRTPPASYAYGVRNPTATGMEVSRQHADLLRGLKGIQERNSLRHMILKVLLNEKLGAPAVGLPGDTNPTVNQPPPDVGDPNDAMPIETSPPVKQAPISDASKIIERAKSVVGKGWKYSLKPYSGNDPKKDPKPDPTKVGPGTPNAMCDCSGYVSWAYGFAQKKRAPYGLKRGKFLTTPVANPMVGDVVARPPLRGMNYPHFGIVAAIDSAATPDSINSGEHDFTVLHCSQPNGPVELANAMQSGWAGKGKGQVKVSFYRPSLIGSVFTDKQGAPHIAENLQNKELKKMNIKQMILEELSKILSEKAFAGKKELDNDEDGVPKWADKDDSDSKVGSKSSKKKGGKVPPQLQKHVKSKETEEEEELDEVSAASGMGMGYAAPLGHKKKVIEEDDAIVEYLTEAEAKKKNPPLGKVTRNPAGSNKKFHVYVKCGGRVKKISFGDPGLSIKRDSPERRKNFRARHKCDKPEGKNRCTARYWSCYQWRAGKRVEGE